MDIQNSTHNLDSRNQSQFRQGTSFIKTCFNGMNALTGIGILSIPYALSQGGWLSFLGFILIAGICFYTGLLLNKCMDSNPLIKTYPDIGGEAFGRNGKIIISVFLYLELFLVAVEFLILEGDNLHKLFPKICFRVFGQKVGGEKTFILITALVILPTTWLRNLSVFAYVSATGLLASIVLISTIFWIGAFEDVGFSEKGVLWRYSGLSTAINLYIFCYSGHPIFPTLCSSMRDNRQFPKVLLVCFTLSTIIYGSMAIIGYLMFGENLMSQVTLNLPTKNLSSKIAIYITLITPITKYAIIISPIAIAIEEKLIREDNRWISLLTRTLLIISTVFVALIVPFFEYVMSFIGAFLNMSVSILFPCACYLKINKESLNCGVELISIVIVIFLGIFVGGIGTFISVSDIVKHIVHTK